VGCQKQLFGLELDGNYFRFGVCHFGIKTSGNAFAELLKPLIRHWQVTHDVRIILWVDDICVICPSKCTQPDQCGGPDECVECASCLKRAQALDAQFTKDIKALGFETNRKDVPPTLSAIFLGMGFDTRTMEFWVDADKAAVFAETCALMQKSGQATRREIAKLVGKLMWWDPALFNVKLMSRALQGLIAGIKEDWQWDQVVPISIRADRELVFWRDHVVSLAKRRKPMIMPRVSDLEVEWDSLVQGYKPEMRKHFPLGARLVTDGGPTHWGATLFLPDGSQKKASGEYRPVDVAAGRCRQQPWREGYAVIEAVKAFQHLIQGKAVLHLSDCKCVVAAIAQGSTNSEMLQDQAIELWEMTTAMGILFFSAWVPGDTVITLGADALSRREGLDFTGLGVNDFMWARVQESARAQGWQLTVDLFASQENARLPRFYSFHHTPGAEGVDAFEKRSWAQESCPCGEIHQECVYVFPPTELLLATWTRLQRDGARGVAVVPVTPGAPWWALLRTGQVGDAVRFSGSHITIPTGCESLNKLDKITNLEFAVVAFDFTMSRTTTNVHMRDDTSYPPSLPCPQGVARRPPRPMDMDDEARRFLLRTLAEPTARTVRAEASRDLCPL